MSRHAHAVRWQHHRIARGTPVIYSREELDPSRVYPRDAPEETTTGSKCDDDDKSSKCEKPAASSSKLPMILLAIVPIAIACVVLYFLHRRHLRKLALEEATDKTKSMDFGMHLGPASRMNQSQQEKDDSRSRKQMSMDMNLVASPYLLPQNVNGSRDSLARTVHSMEDRYGRSPLSPTVTRKQRKHDENSLYNRHDDSPDGSRMNMEYALLDGASRMPTSTPPPPRTASLSSPISSPPVPSINLPIPPRAKSPSLKEVSEHTRDAFQRHSQETSGNLPPALQVYTPPRSQSPFADPVITVDDHDHKQRPISDDRSSYNSYGRPLSDDRSDYGDNGIQFRFSNASAASTQIAAPVAVSGDRKSLAPGAIDNRRLSMGARPLPPAANPEDTAEERAMRIRSFYKEYFSTDESAAPPIPQPPSQYVDYAQEYTAGLDDFDAAPARPFAEPPMRRAMTPPPRMPPRFMGPAAGGPRSRAGSAAGRHQEARSYSSASGRLPRRPVPPPQPLSVLPSPSLLNESAFASPHMFAPVGRVHRDPAAGAKGGLRPYSPAVSPHIPLASAFDELPSMPSPHMLRKSSTFTALDFAPPRKFKDDGTMSDAGSIRSNRSGASALQVQNIRSGAYRVSRIPTEVVPLRDEMTVGLKPTWDLGYGKTT